MSTAPHGTALSAGGAAGPTTSVRPPVRGKKRSRFAKRVLDVVASEACPKFVDFVLNSGITTSLTLQELTIPSTAVAGVVAAVNARIGPRVVLDRLELRWTGYSGDDQNQVRLIVGFAPLETDAAPIPSGLILESVAPAWLAPQAYASSVPGTIKFLYDRSFALCLNGPAVQTDTKEIKLGFESVYAMSGTGPLNGRLFIATISDSVVLPNPVIAYVARLWFHDAL